jgi:hypothetical protein
MNELIQRLDSSKNIRVYDDTGRNATFEITKILYEDDNIIVGEATDEEMRTDVTSDCYLKNFKVMINKYTLEVTSFDLRFYLAENY